DDNRPGGVLRCPHCHAGLRRQERAYRCADGHSFDVARQGYVNLLPSSRRHSKDPGDNREMILSRRRFLEGGFYATISKAINGAVLAALPKDRGEERQSILDAGAGEGYYLACLEQSLVERLPAPMESLYGVDVSRHAMQYATHRSKAVTWLVASIVDLPVVSSSLDILLSVFAPLAPGEFQRVLRPGGTLVVVGPGPRHLYSLRQLLYADVLPHQADPLLASLMTYFTPRKETELTYPIDLPSAAMIGDLLTMTPFGWNIDAARRAQAEATAPLRTTVDVHISVFEPLSGY
ncbi:MAG TPA: methyltransferase domain-containing protein, partial [Chloroflexota bacterium]